MDYIFTDGSATKIIEVVYDPDWLGEHAAKHRRLLQRKLKKQVISWCHMGGDNPPITGTAKK